MGFFNFGKKDKILDLTKKYPEKEKPVQVNSDTKPQSQELPSQGALGFLGNFSQVNQTSNETEASEERKRKLAKRFSEMTSRMEELSNQIYHLQQRVELLEKKMGSERY